MQTPNRTFTAQPAKRERTPLLIGLVGPSGGGKTYSALRLATGIQRLDKRPIYVIDTESRRALHYADRFRFQHVDFRAPFGSLDYLAALEYCVAEGAGTVIVDSLSHEHAGPGGMLEQHDQEVARLAALWHVSEQKAQIPAWARPKAERSRLVNGILQLGINLIACFRAKEKIKIVTGKDPIDLGWQPIAGEEFIYEMVLKCFLLPGADGVPSWESERPGERAMMKRPEQFRGMFEKPVQLSEDIGEAMARWSAGEAVASGVTPAPSTIATTGNPTPAEALIDGYAACSTAADLRDLEAERKALWPSLSADTKRRLKLAADLATKHVADIAASAEQLRLDADAPNELADEADAVLRVPA